MNHLIHYFARMQAWAVFMLTTIVGGIAPSAFAAQADISSTPMSSARSALVKPNIMLLMDTSGSMGWTHMPDELETTIGVGSVGYKSPQCNALYYNPRTTYRIPKKPDGTLFPTPAFSAAPYAGYVSYFAAPDITDQSTVNLSSAFQAFAGKTLRNTAATGDTPQAAYYYVHSSGVALGYANAACADTDTGADRTATGGGNWTRKLVTSTSGLASTTGIDERANFAIWYSFYRTRISLTKSAASLAFTPLTDTYRVGFITVRPNNLPTSGTFDQGKYLAINDFNSTQRTSWFNKLFAQIPGGSSPAREGLARVGRHYGGKQDGINTGMTGDPVQYSCQQNFTIMTTDGYWNTQGETPGGGPVQLDGTTLVGNQDNNLANPLTPRPMYEGDPDGTGVVEDNRNTYSYGNCGSFFYLSTRQFLASTVQNRQSTNQVTQTTTQTTVNTAQRLQSTYQALASTSQITLATTQNLSQTKQILKTTRQNLRSTTQNIAITTQPTQTVTALKIATSQPLRSTNQITQTTAQITRSTAQTLQSTTQNLLTSTQNLRSTTQITRSTTQALASTSQASRTTTQITTTSTQVRKSTSQTTSCDASTELCSFTPTCTPSAFVTCSTATSGPSLVASCTAELPNAGNGYKTTTCDSAVIGPNGASSCSPQTAGSGNSYTTITCGNVSSAATLVASCTASAANSGNSWTATNCTYVTSGPTAVASCTDTAASAGNNYTSTTCITNNSGPTGVASCSVQPASSGNSWTATTCGNNNTSNVPVASCSASSAGSGNGYTATTCSTNNNTPNTPVASCSPVSPSSGNGYVTVTCSTNNSSATAVQTCVGASANWTATICTPVNTGPTGVDRCDADTPKNGNSWTTTTCGTNNTGPTGVSSCSSSSRNSGNAWTTTTCGNLSTTDVAVSSCTPSSASSGNSWVTTTCRTATSGPTANGGCSASAGSSGNNWVTTSCPNVVTGPTVVGSCTPVTATSGNGWQQTACGTTSSSAPVASCVPAGNVTCGTNNTANVPVQTCTPSGPTSSNGYTTTTCGTNDVLNAPAASCSASSATSGNSWVTTTCPAPILGSVTPVQTCTAVLPVAGNSYTATLCTVNNPAATFVASCNAVTASSGNAWTTTTCGSVVTTNVGVSSCTPSGPTSGNGYKTTTCPSPAVTTNVPVQTCTAVVAGSGNQWTATTCSSNNTSVGAASCSAAPATLANQWTAITCPAPVVNGPTGVASCTPQPASAGNAWTATTCANPITSNVPVQTCNASGPGSGNNYTTTTCNTVAETDVPVASCTAGPASAGNNWTDTACRTIATGPTLNTACTADPASSANNYTATICAAVSGKKVSYITQRSVTTTVRTNGVLGAPSVNGPITTGSGDVDGSCFAPGSEPSLTTYATAPSTTAGPSGSGKPGPNPPSGCSAWPCATSVIAIGAANGSVNALADVAQYYYATDLRPSMPNTPEEGVPSVGTGPEADTAKWQHMTTFTVALGVSGTLNYLPDYKSASTLTGDFADLRTGTRSWPLWPDPAVNAGAGNYGAWENPRSIDDFWHTAVNGRGQYFSASDSDSLVSGLADALAEIDKQPSAGAAAGVSNAQPVAGDNFVFFSSYVTGDWTGDVTASEIVLTTGALASTNAWSAKDKLLTKVGSACDNRNIYVIRPGANTSLADFSANTFACDGNGAPAGSARNGLNAAELLNFDSSEVALFSQFPSMTAGSGGQQEKAAGANLVNFLRGQSGLEGFKAGDLSKLYRKRESRLGDIIGGQPVYVKDPRATYSDAGYSAFKSAQAGRTAMVYVAANDGMLHAFYADKTVADPLLGGQEAWAVIPSEVLPKMYKLADKNYGKNHQFFVDGSPVVGDVYDSGTSQWSTMLVGGLNAGGKSFYALDITDPVNPVAKWEFKFSATCFDAANAGTAGADCHLGLSFGKPIITKLATGRWVVMVTSGYNNVRGAGLSGDGGGYLYVLDAKTGSILYKIETSAGDATTPSNLGQLNVFIDDSSVSNTAVRAYGGDMLGNIWRFDVNDTELPAGREATLLGQAKDSSGAFQPITTRPELAELDGKPMVFVGTGRLLGAQDVNDVQTQSIYGIVDKLIGSPVYTDLRGAMKPMVVTTAARTAGSTRTVDCDAAQSARCAFKDGWVIDLPDAGERNNIDMILLRTTLVAGTNVPNTSACGKGGDYWLNYIDFATGMSNGAFDGSAVSSTSAVSKFGNNSLITGLSVLDLSRSTGYTGSPIKIVARDSSDGASGAGGDGKRTDIFLRTPPPKGRRISWREIAK
jgi:Tfp pilus tip-associated adhesin PilY1